MCTKACLAACSITYSQPSPPAAAAAAAAGTRPETRAGPHRLTRPVEGRRPTRAWKPEGVRMLLPVSEPKEIRPRLAAMAAAGPPEDPPEDWSRP